MWKWVLVITVLAGLGRSAEAELYSPDWTLSSLMCRSDCVVRGVVVGTEKVDAPGPVAKDSLGWVRVHLEVRETLIGKPVSTLIFYRDNSEIPDWAKNKSEQLFFLTTGKHAGEGHPGDAESLALVEWADVFEEPLSLETDQKRRILADDFRVLSSGDEILAEARRVAGMRRVSGSSATIRVPGRFFGAPDMRFGQWVEMGLTEGAMKSAREWIELSDPQMQWCGAEILFHEKSPENAAALLRFAWTMRQAGRYDAQSEIKILEVLRGWGVSNLPPWVRSKPIFDVGSGWAWVSLLGIVVAPGISILFCRGWRRCFLVVMWWLIFSGLLVLEVRSYWPQDAVAWGDFALALEEGDVYIEHLDAGGGPGALPLMVTSPEEILKEDEIPFAPGAEVRQLSNLGDDGSGMFFGWKNFADKYRIEPLFTRSSMRRCSLWFVGATWVAPWALIWGWRCVRYFRNKRRRGFPVELAEKAGV